jgi:FkbM family methyltransferase
LSFITRSARQAFEKLTGIEIVPVGNRHAFVRRRARAWFSYRSQLQTILQTTQTNLVLDIGANEGQFCRELREIYSGEVWSFEPVDSVFKVLSAASQNDELWRVHRLALGASFGTHVIRVARETSLSSFRNSTSFGVARFGQEMTQDREERVTVKRLDEVMGASGINADDRNMFLKMDTQGFDLDVFQGLGDWLKRVVAIQTELSLISIYEDAPHWTEAILVYEKAGFGVVGLYPVTKNTDGRVIEYDCLLIRT